MLGREAEQRVRNWREKAGEEQGGKIAEVYARSLKQAARLPDNAPLKKAWKRWEEGSGEEEGRNWVEKWNEGVRRRGDSRWETATDRPHTWTHAEHSRVVWSPRSYQVAKNGT